MKELIVYSLGFKNAFQRMINEDKKHYYLDAKCIHLINFSPNRTFLSILRMNPNYHDHKLSLRPVCIGCLVSFYPLLRYIASFAINIASINCLPLINPSVWSLPACTSLFFIYSVKTIDNNLQELPIKIIGLNSLSSFAPFFFGIKAIQMALKLLSNIFFSQNMEGLHDFMLKSSPTFDEKNMV